MEGAVETEATARLHDIAEQECRANPALQSIRMVIDDYLDEGRTQRFSKAVSGPGSGELSVLPVLLLVGGDDNIEAVLKIVLHDIPHKFLWAREAADLTEVLGDETPDVIVGETVSGKADGFRLMQMVKGSSRAAATPVVLLNRETGLDQLYATYSALGKGRRVGN